MAPHEPLPFELPLGARPTGEGRVRFRVWAPDRERVAVELGGARHPLTDDGLGVWSAELAAQHGDRYRVVLDDEEPLPDPATRWQPDGLRGPSAVVDPAKLARAPFDGVAREDLVVYELHIGTFTAEGTFDAAIEHLAFLAELGITAIEVMPVAEFPGRHGWGYDGVYHSAAQSSYGGPEGFARLVAAAHERGLAVLLDVVYNHVGASGNTALAAFGPYFTEKYSTFWGAAMNYDDEHSGAVREWVLQSAEGWISDFGVDGLRLDAIHAIFDGSAVSVLTEIADRVHAANPKAIVIAESGMNDPKVTRPKALGGFGHDAVWADDFHHALRTLLTGEREGYYEEFGKVADLVKAYHRPFVHDGTWSSFRQRRFGAPAPDRPVTEFVVFSQDHDQVGNRAMGDRLPADLQRLAAFATLLSPFVPMLWQGEEYGEPGPFQFFADHIDEEIATATRDGRRREFASFADFSGEEVPDPMDPATFERSKLTRRVDEQLLALYRKLLRVRRDLPKGECQATGDEEGRWVRVVRMPYELLMHFGDEPGRVPTRGGQVVLETHPGTTRMADDHVVLGPKSGVLVRV